MKDKGKVDSLRKPNDFYTTEISVLFIETVNS
jgi:hypothetical protein